MLFFSILTGVLKIIAALLIVTLLIIILVLFVPIRYDLFAGRNGSFCTKGIITWLFRAVKVTFEKTPKKSSMKIVIFGKLINGGRKKSKKKGRKHNQNKTDTKIPEATEPLDEITNPSESLRKAEAAKTSEMAHDKKPVKAFEASQNKTIQEPSTETKKKPKSSLTAQKEEESKTVDEKSETVDEKGIMEKISFLYNYPDRNRIIHLTIKLVRDLLLALKPKHFSLKGELGTNDPATTGYIIGLFEILKPSTGLDISLTGNFNNSVLNGEIVVKGNFFIYKIIYPLCKYVFTKPIWKIIKKYLFKKDDVK